MPLKIGMIDSSVRIRDMKEMVALKEIYGNEIQFHFFKTLNIPGHESKVPGIKVVYIDPNKPPMQKRILNLCKNRKIDLLHTHNYPDNYGKWGLNIRDELGIPVVHECHDIGYENVKPAAANLTSVVMKRVDKIITVSSGMTDYLHKMYNVKNKCTIIYPYPNKRFVPKKLHSIRKNCSMGVYQGGINFTNNPSGKYNHRYYKKIFIKIVNQGMTIDVYPAHNSNATYGHPYIKFKRSIANIGKLYRVLANYDWGFLGYNQTKSKVMDIAMPNKLFEYIACGIPVIAMNYNLIGRFINNNKFGIVLNKKTLAMPKNKNQLLINAKKNVVKRRMEFVMEEQAEKIMNIYRSVL